MHYPSPSSTASGESHGDNAVGEISVCCVLGAQRTVMDFAVEAIHKGYNIRQSMQTSDQRCLQRMPRFAVSLLCDYFSGRGDAVFQTYPFETGGSTKVPMACEWLLCCHGSAGRLVQRWTKCSRRCEQQRSAADDVVSLNRSRICLIHTSVTAALQWILGFALTIYCMRRSRYVFSTLQGLCEKVNGFL